jgi:hypothetical protein
MDAKEIKKAETTDAPAAGIPAKDHHRDKRIALVVCGAAVLVLVGLVAGVWMHIDREHNRQNPMISMVGERGIMRMGLENGSSINPTDGSTITRLTGVVTQVNGDSFTIAGNGTTKTIKTDSNTSYNTTDKKVSVNDSVIVTGTDSNGTFTATTVSIVNVNR